MFQVMQDADRFKGCTQKDMETANSALTGGGGGGGGGGGNYGSVYEADADIDLDSQNLSANQRKKRERKIREQMEQMEYLQQQQQQQQQGGFWQYQQQPDWLNAAGFSEEYLQQERYLGLQGGEAGTASWRSELAPEVSHPPPTPPPHSPSPVSLPHLPL